MELDKKHERTLISENPNMEEHPTNEENMEVHKHSHHVMHKKKWPEYLLEFVMLFLAVFLGFLAENIRENSVERQRAKEYIFSFYEDLKKDIATFSRISAFDDLKEAELKNIFCCYDTLSKNWKNTSCLIPLINNSRTNYSIAFSNGTLQQLKNAGGFRLLGIDDRDTIMSSIIPYRTMRILKPLFSNKARTM